LSICQFADEAICQFADLPICQFADEAILGILHYWQSFAVLVADLAIGFF